MSKVLNTPWDFNLQVPHEISRQSSQLQLQANLAELAKGTIAMFRPRWRTAPKVAWPHRSTSFDPFADENGKPISPDSITVANVPIVAPVPVVPAGPALRAHFMTKAYFAPLSPAKAAFVQSFQPLPSNEINNRTSTESHAPPNAAADDDDVIVYMTPDVTAAHSPGNGEDVGHEEATNENSPPAARFVDENENTARAPAIPAPNLRGPRRPFGVLYYDVENAPSHGRSLSIEEEVPYPVLHETATRVSVTAPRGWARLRPLAPSPINIEDVKRKMNLRHQNYVETPKQATSGTSQAPWVDNVLPDIVSFGALEKVSVRQGGIAGRLSFLQILDAINPGILGEERRRWQKTCPV
ncbi:hypothetical protein Hypma_012225 [Hypsizygus marmoreus]|uniref:Uncharacterized protein n=1 Tax=Hypsizygus marmoreus TaxID=39966 RepID=A0A369JF25_HYPMA|nr:hypothetical protein Hypma_012225 [Hypsizygus marmoreus]